MTHSLAGLVKPARSVAFSPNTTLLAAAGDSRTIALYDVKSGEQIANLAGHGGWVLTLDWSDTGEYLLSGYVMAPWHDLQAGYNQSFLEAARG